MIWNFYVLTFYGVIKLRREQPDAYRPYKVPLYPFIPIVAMLGGSYVVISTIISQFPKAVVGFGIMLVGLPIYAYYENKEKKQTID